MKYDKLEILDVEKTRDEGRFKVTFEVPGKHFNQDYPKRLSHTFPKQKKFFEEVENGLKRYEKIVRDLYLADSDNRKERGEADAKIEEAKKHSKGKSFSK